MDEEKKEDVSKKFGKIINALHNKAKLSSLRTYQGDVAEFIKNKNESVVSIAVKEKERKEERIEEKEKLELLPKSNKKSFQISFTMFFLSLLLIAGGVFGFFYAFEAFKEKPLSEVIIKEEIIPYNNSITLANVTNANFGSEFKRLSSPNGISIVRISDTNGLSFQKVKDFFDFLKISPPLGLGRTLKDQYVVGIISQNEESSSFIVITIDDFGRAFSAMLDWEENMVEDLSFLSAETNTTTVASTTVDTTVPMKPEFFSWKDIIIKNKDTRAFANDKKEAKIAYTFLDKNTILITNNLFAIGDISSAYASRSIVR